MTATTELVEEVYLYMHLVVLVRIPLVCHFMTNKKTVLRSYVANIVWIWAAGSLEHLH
jgi:hypothetical protein